MQSQVRLPSNGNPAFSFPQNEMRGPVDWKTYLEGCSPCSFPSLNTVRPSQSWPASVSITIGDSIFRRLELFSDKTGISAATVFRAAWALVLRTYTGQDSVCFGDMTTAPGGIDAIGWVGVCRVELSDTAVISKILQRIQAASADKLAIPLVPLSDAVLSKCLPSASLFNTCMLISGGGEKPEKTSSTLEKVELGYDGQYDIIVRGSVEDRGASAALSYRTSFLSEEQATSIANTFERAVSDLIGIENRIGQICFLSDLDKSQIYTWNKDPPLRAHSCVDTLIHERCLSQPTASAVNAWDGEFSYGELKHLSSKLSRHLIALGVGAEVFVPLCFEKSRWTTVAMLAVIKAGGAFVLLDPSHPAERLFSICQQVSARLIVASAQHAKLAEDLVTSIVEVGDDEADWLTDRGIKARNQTRTRRSVAPGDALYAVFTSGSTGTPKGVIIEHGSFHAAVFPYTEAVGLNQESRVFQFSSYAFDVTIFDTLMTLISGGCVCVPSNTERWSDVANAIQRFRVTHSSLTPTVARILDPKDVPTLRTLVLGGEKLVTSDITKWVDQVRLVHLYGASECPIMSIQLMTGVASDFQTTDHATGSNCWIVDPNNHDRLVPIGTIGELVIEGTIVGRGYLDDPEKSSATFIRPPGWLCQVRGSGYHSAVYKSGDLVQYTADGSLRYIGRKDTQVKLRGQRVELGEVEHHVKLTFPNATDVVAELVVTIHASSSRAPILVAFVLISHEADPDSKSLRIGRGVGLSQILSEPTDRFCSQIPIVQSQLQQSLPSYMVPGIFLPLETLPLTSTDKINRKLLRELAGALSREELESYQPSTGPVRAPQTTTEKLLQQYFARVLNIPVEQVGADDHFFQRGGDSLTAMKLVAMARKDKHKLTVQDIFDSPRLSALACVVRSGKVDGNKEPPLEPFSLVNKHRDVIRAAAQQCQLPVRVIEDVYPCTPLQRGLISETLRDSEAFITHLAVSLPPDIDLQRLQEAWTAVANANPILRTRMVLSASHGLLQVVVREDIRWIVSKNAEAQDFVVGVGKPLVQLVLCCHREGNQVPVQLLLMVHHAVYDGYTLPLIFEQVKAAYNGSILAPRPAVPFIRYVQSIPDGTGYWNSLMANLQTPIFPALPSKTYQPLPNAIMRHTIITTGSHIRQYTPSSYVRLAWAITQAYHQGTCDVFFGTVVSGRNAPVTDIELMTIPTVATIPCRVTLDSQSLVQTALRKIQDDAISGIPFEQLGLPHIRRLGEHATLACSFQTLLSIQPALPPSTDAWLEQPGSTIDYRANATYAINLFFGLGGNELKATALYDFNVVKEDKMQSMLVDFGNILQTMHKSPNSLIRDILDPQQMRGPINSDSL
uniref:Lysergyl peptide synthetase subunit 2 n=1 Tax=Epichloe coenophiala TaxID=5047 RepID=S5SNX3_EPICN|nr:lysergyl peptide synthetase subunit 2 [Epichloe coenophiala]